MFDQIGDILQQKLGSLIAVGAEQGIDNQRVVVRNPEEIPQKCLKDDDPEEQEEGQQVQQSAAGAFRLFARRPGRHGKEGQGADQCTLACLGKVQPAQ